MWIKSYSKIFQNITKEQIWEAWEDMDNWSKWNPGVEYCHREKPFATGSYFVLKPTGMSPVHIKLVEVEKNKKFVDCTKFFGAKMYGIHEMSEEKEGLKLTVTIQITGPLNFLWRKLLAEKIAAKSAAQTEALVQHARSDRKN